MLSINIMKGKKTMFTASNLMKLSYTIELMTDLFSSKCELFKNDISY